MNAKSSIYQLHDLNKAVQFAGFVSSSENRDNTVHIHCRGVGRLKRVLIQVKHLLSLGCRCCKHPRGCWTTGCVGNPPMYVLLLTLPLLLGIPSTGVTHII